VNLTLHSPEAVQKQLSDAVSIIGRYDFPNKWPGLISQMVEKFATGTYIFIFEGCILLRLMAPPKIGTYISVQLVLNAYKVLHFLMIDTVSFSSKNCPPMPLKNRE
jgi:hypothetical protein